MRALDERAIGEYKIPSLILMENAGRSVAEEVLRFDARHIVVVCGKGNNGGDGFVAARHLYNRGRNVRVTFLGSRDRMKGDPAANFEILDRLGVPIHIYEGRDPVHSMIKGWDWLRADLIVDAIFGTGLSSSTEEPYRSAIEEINKFHARGIPVVSIDIPSGLNADTGEVMGAAVQATLTVTLACEKTGLRKGAGPRHSGRILVGDISMPRALLDEGI